MGGRELEVDDKGQVHGKRVLEGRMRVLVHGKVQVLAGHMVLGQGHGRALAHGKLVLADGMVRVWVGHMGLVQVGGRVLELEHKKNRSVR